MHTRQASSELQGRASLLEGHDRDKTGPARPLPKHSRAQQALNKPQHTWPTQSATSRLKTHSTRSLNRPTKRPPKDFQKSGLVSPEELVLSGSAPCILVITGDWTGIKGSKKENGQGNHKLQSISSPCLLFRWSVRFCIHSNRKRLPAVRSIFTITLNCVQLLAKHEKPKTKTLVTESFSLILLFSFNKSLP